MGNPLHFIQASDTSAFAALHTEQGALPSQYEALQAYLKKIGLGRVRHPVGRTRYRAGHTGGLRLHFLVYAAGRRRHPPLPPRRGRSPNRRGLPCAGRGKPSPPISTTRPAASCSARRCSSLRRTMSSSSTAIPCSSTGACSRKARTKPRPRYSGASRKTGKRPPV